MTGRSIADRVTNAAQATDTQSVDRHFGGGNGLLPLWIAEPYVDLASEVRSALESRAAVGWYGYETRPDSIISAFWDWMVMRHGWNGSQLRTMVSPSVGTSIGVLIEQMTTPGSGVILQPPVFTDFKPMVIGGGRVVVRNPLRLTADGYRMDIDDLASKAADPSVEALILCNPHNPVGRVWTPEELAAVEEICARNGVFVIADEIHADIALSPHTFTPFAEVATSAGTSWAALHGPSKTFGLAGVCDTLVVMNDGSIASKFEASSSRLHLTRNNVFGLAAFEAAYRGGARWLDELLGLVDTNWRLLDERLPEELDVVPLEGTYLAWLDFRRLGMEVPELAHWLSRSARLGLSPGHWFGREGAGFARITLAAPRELIEEAVVRLTGAIAKIGR